MSVWQLQDAKARFSELLRAARKHGPQTVTIRGKPAAIVVSPEDYAASGRAGPSTWDEVFAPARALGGICVGERDPRGLRDIDFNE